MRQELKGLIVMKYRTQHRFAVCCGKKENWISRIISGRDNPSDEEQKLIQRKLDIPDSELNRFFSNDDE